MAETAVLSAIEIVKLDKVDQVSTCTRRDDKKSRDEYIRVTTYQNLESFVSNEKGIYFINEFSLKNHFEIKQDSTNVVLVGEKLRKENQIYINSYYADCI